jgi:uncharacterized coiled-coil protein SlyX
MLPFLKKKSEVAAAPEVPAWHANFRNYEKLPDIKIVRTAFFINVAAITVTVALLTYFSIQEWKLRAINQQVAEWQRQIDRDKKASEQAIALFKKFQLEEAKINEVEAFVQSKPSLAALVIRLAQTTPPAIAIDSLDLRETGMALRISIKGTPAAASQTASNFREQLQNDTQFGQRFEKVEFTSSPSRNPTTGRMAVELFLHLKGAKK